MIKQLAVTIIAVIFCVAAYSQSDEKANILALEKSTADALTKHNIPFLNSAFTDDANFITATGTIISKQQMLQALQNINSVSVADMKVNIQYDVAIVTGTEIQTGKDNVGPYTLTLVYTDVVRKVNGKWIIISTQATPVK